MKVLENGSHSIIRLGPESDISSLLIDWIRIEWDGCAGDVAEIAQGVSDGDLPILFAVGDFDHDVFASSAIKIIGFKFKINGSV